MADHAPREYNDGNGNPRYSREERVVNLLRYSFIVCTVQTSQSASADDAGSWMWWGRPEKTYTTTGH